MFSYGSVVHALFSFSYLNFGGSSFIMKYTGYREISHELNTFTPSVFMIKDTLNGCLKN